MLSERDFPFHYEKVLQQLFSIAAIVPSLELGLIDPDNLTASGDGTCVHSHANPYGHRVCKCSEKGIKGCMCPRHFSDPDASWGWDSAAQLPVGRRKSVRAKSPVSLLPTGAAFIPNLIGIYVCILRFQGEQKNT